MLDKLGATGIAGILLTIIGIAIVAYKAPIVALGLLLVLVGVALVVRRGIKSVMGMFGI